MKDLTEAEWRQGALPSFDADHMVKFCLERLFSDREHVAHDSICRTSKGGLTFEELIGALLVIEDHLAISRELVGESGSSS